MLIHGLGNYDKNGRVRFVDDLYSFGKACEYSFLIYSFFLSSLRVLCFHDGLWRLTSGYLRGAVYPSRIPLWPRVSIFGGFHVDILFNITQQIGTVKQYVVEASLFASTRAATNC